MRRREFITLLGGATVAWPLPTRAQQGGRMRRIGVLMNIAADDPEAQARMTAFVQELGQLGWIAGVLDIAGVAHIDRAHLHSERRRRGPRLTASGARLTTSVFAGMWRSSSRSRRTSSSPPAARQSRR
jgi:hypothetical protein